MTARYVHSTIDELEFLTSYALRNPEGFAKYAAIILNDKRGWDSGVDTERVKAKCRELMGEQK